MSACPSTQLVPAKEASQANTVSNVLIHLDFSGLSILWCRGGAPQSLWAARVSTFAGLSMENPERQSPPRRWRHVRRLPYLRLGRRCTPSTCIGGANEPGGGLQGRSCGIFHQVLDCPHPRHHYSPLHACLAYKFDLWSGPALAATGSSWLDDQQCSNK